MLRSIAAALSAITENHCSADPGAGGITIFFSGQISLIDTQVIKNSGPLYGGVAYSFLDARASSSFKLDTLSRIPQNTATKTGSVMGGIFAQSVPVELPSVDNASGNTPNNRLGTAFSGPGAVCTTT